ncbi:MAG: cytidylate kinase family protein [Thermoproteota archaeon]
MCKPISALRRKPVVTFSGLHGTGKTTYARAIAQEFNLRHLSVGGLFRQAAEERGLTLLELTRLAEKDESIDRLIDDEARREAERGGVVIDGQLSAWMAGENALLKIYLTAPLNVRVKRIADRDGVSLEEAERATVERERAERERYLRLYGLDVDDLSVYDLIVDTDLMSLEELTATLKNIVRSVIEG